MTTKSTLKILLLVSLLVTIVLVSGCTTICGPVSGSSDYNPTTYSSPTATATPTVTATPGSTSTTQNTAQPSATVTPTATPTVTPTVTPTLFVSPLYNASNPYATPGWPTYGVYYYLNLNDVPPSTGGIFGYVYEPVSTYTPSPMPVYDYDHYWVHIECDSAPFTPMDLPLDSSGRYEITGLSYGDYIVSWYYDLYPTEYYDTELVTVNSATPVQQNFYVMYW